MLAWAPLALGSSLLFAVIFAVIGLPWWLGVIDGFVISAGIVWWFTRSAVERLVNQLGGVAVSDGDDPRFENLVEGLALSTGLAEPDLYIVADSALNGAALARGESRALVVTSGLLEGCDRIELEGVLAGLLSRLKSGDAEAATLAAVLFGKPVLDSGAPDFLEPLVSLAFRTLFNEHREITNDREAVSVTRYPPGLSSALERILRGPYEPAGVTAGTRHLWFAPPRPAPFLPHSPLSWRLDVLSEA